MPVEKVYSYIRILSLDVVAGALFSTLAISKLLGVSPGLPVLISLSLAVWVIYTFDHLIDARKVSHTAHTPRHRFHQQYFGQLSLTVVVLSIAGLSMLFFFPPATIYTGLVVAAITLIYFLTLRLFRFKAAFQKELFIALVYVLGIFTAPFSLNPVVDYYLILLFCEYLFLALTNLLVFAWYEQDTDRADGHSSLILKVGQRKSHVLILTILSSALTATVIGLVSTPVMAYSWWYQWLVLLMVLFMGLIYFFPSSMGRKERYRAIGDGLFMLPGILLLL